MAKDNRSLQITPARQAILTTLLYSDIFSFPLTRDELWQFLITKEKISPDAFIRGLESFQKEIVLKDGYYCLAEREAIIVKRKSNIAEVAKKLKRAHLIAYKLSVIHSVLFIGITGGLAAGNVTSGDDIDLVIIVKKNTLFLTRLLILGVLERLGVRRYRTQRQMANTICANLLLDEAALSWFDNSKDVYTAREIAQIVPLFERNNMYHRFITANIWIKKLLPNVKENKRFVSIGSSNTALTVLSYCVSNLFFESVSQVLQMGWMKRHKTNETVTKHVLAFHPIDYRFKTLKQLRLKMRQFGLLTKF